MIPTLKETSFYIAETNNVMSWLVFPLIIVGLQLSHGQAVKPLAKLLWWGYKAFPTKTHGVIMRLEAQGEKNGQPHEMQLNLSHENGYMFTAIAVVAALLQYLDGKANQPGLWLMGHLVEPEQFVQDMERLGAQIHIKEAVEYTPSQGLFNSIMAKMP
jgi:saccharopine dehydrogenase (NAD+, L-lysine-forming)